ncbi:hypothetical protein [Enterococcus sp. 2201sp1_2201st1_B8_2201SCRN_220225]|uniref:hypothetical protein n=1 Tax=unclassified Enterococcus TaxID=2608891 RepID=UPI0034A284D6
MGFIKLFRQFAKEHLRQYFIGCLLILLAQVGLVVMMREGFGGVKEAIAVDPELLQVIFILCLIVFVVIENLGIIKNWTNPRYRMLPISASQFYFGNVLFAIVNQLLFFGFLVASWFIWATLFLPMFTWPNFFSLGEFMIEMAAFSCSTTVLWQGAVLIMLSITQQFFTKLRPVVGIICFIGIGSVDSFFTNIGRRIGGPLPTSSTQQWRLWYTPFEVVAALLSMGVFIALSIYLLQHYTEAESRKNHV